MKCRYIIISSLMAFISCNTAAPSNKNLDTAQENNNTAKEYEDLLIKKEDAKQIMGYDTLGQFIATIDFEVKAAKEDLESFEDGIVPWISLEESEKEIQRLIKPDEIVLAYKNVTLIIDYPLNNPVSFEITTTTNGFSRKQLIREISKKYHEIYKEEEVSASTKTIPRGERKGIINRNETDGKYGIWGHDLSDLDLSSVEVYKKSGGKIYLNPGVVS